MRKLLFAYLTLVFIGVVSGLYLFFSSSFGAMLDLRQVILGAGITFASAQGLLLLRPIKHKIFNYKILPLVGFMALNIFFIVVYSRNPYENKELWRWFTALSFASFGYALTLNYRTSIKGQLQIFIRLNNFITVVCFAFLSLLPFIEYESSFLWNTASILLVLVGALNFVKNILAKRHKRAHNL